MITARDIALPAWPTAPAPAAAPSSASVSSRWERILHGTLFVTVLLSCIAIVEPSPHDGMMGVLLLVAVFAGVRAKRMLVPLVLLLIIWNIGGLLALTNVPDNSRAITYTAVSLYLAFAAILFATLIAENTMARMDTIRTAYIIAAVITAIAGMVGYFNIIPRLHEVLTLYSRATGFFKDPNVYGPFLIWPALFLIARMLTERFTIRDCAVLGVIIIGFFLSMSRGAWMHFLLSGVVMVALLFITAKDNRFRLRIVGFGAAGAFALIALVVVVMSIPQVQMAVADRANVVNSYDVGEGGRFTLQEIALGSLLEYPIGMGPFEFARIHGLQQHNVYLQGFMVYGWLGGMTYLLLLLVTLLVGLRNSLAATPWQTYAIVAFAVFVGEVGEGVIIDTDHWRHFFLVLGMVWGLAAATRDYTRQRITPAPQG